MPDNLTDVFKTLVIKTYDDDKDNPIPLDMRGDGIQARHIPIILKYIEEQDLQTTAQGSMNVFTIWGYEEPENGVELLQAFKLANSFEEYSKEIQIFTTSHSPAFYMKNKSSDATVFFIAKDNSLGTKCCKNIVTSQISETMGLMPIVAPYIEEQAKIVEKLKEDIKDIKLADVATISVEGITDKEYFTCAINLFSEKLSMKLKNDELRIYTNEDAGGCMTLIDYALAWIYSKNHTKLTLIFDGDAAGIKSRSKITTNKIYKDNTINKNAKAIKLSVSELIKTEIFNKGLYFPFETEHLLSINCWKELIKKGWTETRPFEEFTEILKKKNNLSLSVIDLLNQLKIDKDIRDTIIMNNPKEHCKTEICNWITKKCSEEEQREFLAGLIPTIKELEQRYQ